MGMATVRVVNWCVEQNCKGFMEKWLVRFENDGTYREIPSDVHNHLLNGCVSIEAAINAVSSSHDRPIPYHLIAINEVNGRIQAFQPRHNYWENVEDIPMLAKIAHEIRLVTVIVKKQEQPTGECLNRARLSVLKDPNLFFAGTSKKEHHVTEKITLATNVKPTELVITEQHNGNISTRRLSAKETLKFIKAHALHAHQQNDTFTVYKLHLNRNFARVVQAVICGEILTQKQATDSKPWWSQNGYVFLPNSFFRFVFFTDGKQADQCPLLRVFLEQYFTVPCELGTYNATSCENVRHMFSEIAPLKTGEQTTIKRLQSDVDVLTPATIVDASRPMEEETNIAVFDYSMFYPYVMYIAADSHAYQTRVLHMTKSRTLVPALKQVYVKELGMLGIVRQQLYNRMHSLSLTILGTLKDVCKQIGLRVIITQTDSVTVRVPDTVFQAHGASLEALASVVQDNVRHHHPSFLSELKLERQGTDMILYGPNKHILYDGEKLAHISGLHAKTFCSAMTKTMEELTVSKTKAIQLLCSTKSHTELREFVENKLRQHASHKTDLVCQSYSLPMPLLVHTLHVQPGENGLFSNMPLLYLALKTYRADNEQTMPTCRSFMAHVNKLGVDLKHLRVENTKRVLESLFTEDMGVIRWSVVYEELLQYFALKMISFLQGGHLV